MSRLPEIESLKLLLGVAATGSIGQAASEEGMSQPAASKRLMQLERVLGVPLLERTRSGSSLTPEGKAVVDWAARVVSEIEHLMDAARAFHTPAAADLTVAASLTIAEHLVPTWISRLRRVEPGTHVSLSVTNSHDVQQLVHERRVDLGLVETTTPDRTLKRRVLAHDQLIVVVAPNHPWARRRRPLAPSELAGEQLIVRESGSGTRETLDRTLAPYGPAEPLLELGSNAAVRGAVRAGAGPAVLSELAVADELVSGRLVAVHVQGLDLRRPLTALWRHRLTGPASAFLGCTRSERTKAIGVRPSATAAGLRQ